jgi:sec-independent protein translocase protein TatC
MSKKSNLRGEMPFLDHLEELRWRILWSIIALIVGVVVGFLLVQQFSLLDVLISPYEVLMGEGERLNFFSPTEPFFLILKVSFLVGFILVSPI